MEIFIDFRLGKEAETEDSANGIDAEIGLLDLRVRDVAIAALDHERPTIVQHQARAANPLQVELDRSG
jgi:hypothetical protein